MQQLEAEVAHLRQLLSYPIRPAMSFCNELEVEASPSDRSQQTEAHGHSMTGRRSLTLQAERHTIQGDTASDSDPVGMLHPLAWLQEMTGRLEMAGRPQIPVAIAIKLAE